MKVGFSLPKCPNSIRIEDMKMDIEIKASAKLLKKGNRACLCTSRLYNKTAYSGN